MKALFASATLVVGLMASAGVFAKANEATAPAGTPAGTTGLCNDGSANTTATKSGACKGHKGIKVWYTAGAAASVSTPVIASQTTTSTTATTAPAATPAAAPAKRSFASLFSKKTVAPAAGAAAVTTTTAATTTTKTTTPTVAAVGGGAGQVWVNTSSKVYHCQSSKYYGKTKTGQYMTEAAAKAAGARPDHGKACM